MVPGRVDVERLQLNEDTLWSGVGDEDPFIDRVRDARDRLAGPEIGPDDRVMEWAQPFEEAEPDLQRFLREHAEKLTADLRACLDKDS